MDEYEKWLTIKIELERWWVESSTAGIFKDTYERRALELEAALKQYRRFKAENAETLLVHIAKI